jgi:hypothetical protein
MTRRRCKHEFCWQCFAPYKGPTGIWRAGNSAHQNTCPYYTNGDKPSLKATQKVFTDETGNQMAQKITNDKQQDNSSAIGSPAEHSVRRDLEMISLTGKDKDSARSKSLGKRKHERSVEVNDDQAKQQPAEQDEECIVCLELVATSTFPDTKHASGRQHSSDVCLGCWDQHIVSEMRSKNFEAISCLRCSDRLVEGEVRRLTKESTYAEYVLKPGVMEINVNLFTRYLDRGAKSCMQQDEEFQSCPSVDCPWGSYISTMLCLRFPVVLTGSTGASQATSSTVSCATSAGVYPATSHSTVTRVARSTLQAHAVLDSRPKLRRTKPLAHVRNATSRSSKAAVATTCLVSIATFVKRATE